MLINRTRRLVQFHAQRKQRCQSRAAPFGSYWLQRGSMLFALATGYLASRKLLPPQHE